MHTCTAHSSSQFTEGFVDVISLTLTLPSRENTPSRLPSALLSVPLPLIAVSSRGSRGDRAWPHGSQGLC